MNLPHLIQISLLVIGMGLLVFQCLKLMQSNHHAENRLSYMTSITQEVQRFLAHNPVAREITAYLLAHSGATQDRVIGITELRGRINMLAPQNEATPLLSPQLTAGMINEAMNLYAEGMDVDLFMATVLNAYLDGLAVEVEHISGKPSNDRIEDMTGHVLLSKLSINGKVIWSRSDGNA